MNIFKKNPAKSLFERAMEGKKTAPSRIAKLLIGEMDKEIEDSIKKGYQAAFLYPFRYNLSVNNEVLEIMKSHYESQGFKDVSFERESNVESSRYKTFNVRWWEE